MGAGLATHVMRAVSARWKAVGVGAGVTVDADEPVISWVSCSVIALIVWSKFHVMETSADS